MEENIINKYSYFEKSFKYFEPYFKADLNNENDKLNLIYYSIQII